MNATATASGKCNGLISPLLNADRFSGSARADNNPEKGKGQGARGNPCSLPLAPCPSPLTPYPLPLLVVRCVGCAVHGSSGHGCFGYRPRSSLRTSGYVRSQKLRRSLVVWTGRPLGASR